MSANHYPHLPEVRPTECTQHPQSGVWESSSGARCPICGVRLDGTQQAPEPVVIRSFAEYERQASRLASKKTERDYLISALGLAEEAGEVVGVVRKAARARIPVQRETIRDELGDALWNLYNNCQLYDLTLAEVAEANLRKLEEILPNGCGPEAVRELLAKRGQSIPREVNTDSKPCCDCDVAPGKYHALSCEEVYPK